MRRIAFVLAIAIGALFAAVPADALASFGLKAFDVRFTGPNGEMVAQAGAHPYAMTTLFLVNTETVGGETFPEGQLKDIEIAQIPGLVGDQTAMPQCSTADFLQRVNGINNATKCADSTVVGIAHVSISEGAGLLHLPQYSAVYNLEAPPGTVARLGFNVLGTPITFSVTLSEHQPYDLVVHTRNISQILEFLSAEVTIWGVPADRSHDALRGECLNAPFGTSEGSCPSGVAPRPFLTLPRACEGPLASRFEIDSWQEPGAWVTGEALTHDNASPPNPQGMLGCRDLSFAPQITAQPTAKAASSPTGLDFGMDFDDEGLKNSAGAAQSDLKKAVVTLPQAVTVNPALAEGLVACSEADLSRETASSNAGEGCPEESKIGSVEVETPLLGKTLKGGLYLATPYQNPFDSLLALYVVIKDPQTGILLRIPGKVVPDEITGQLVTTFDNLPELPFSHFRLHFREGQRSPLATPDLCGTYTTQADLTPRADPAEALHDTSSFQVISGIDGSACPAGGVPPFKPGLVAGTENNNAGGYSHMYIRITRNDGEQEITGFSSLLPLGLTANLTGVPFCSEADIALAKAKSGAEEEASPSCPVASEIGHSLVGVGVGSVLAYNPGKLYMAGPYDGAPFSVVSVTAAKVGPFDLGTVIVHLPLKIDPTTAQVSIPAGAADQIPHIIKGIVVHVRDIRVYVDRPNFTLDPTNCQPLSFAATVYGAGQNTADPADDVPSTVVDRFQAANCANLAFKPTFKVSTSGKTSRLGGASLHVSLSYPAGSLGKDANIRSVKVDLPKQLPARLPTLQKACTKAQFDANPAGCPAASAVGRAKAVTPILPVPLEGPVYFVSNGGEAWPNLIMVLQGYGVTIDLVGDTLISKQGVTSSTFKTIPDQPVSSFELTLPEGSYSALAALGNLCAPTKTVTVKKRVTVKVHGRRRTVTRKVKQAERAGLVMPTEFVAQNGATVQQQTPIEVTGCPKAKTAAKGRPKRAVRPKR